MICFACDLLQQFEAGYISYLVSAKGPRTVGGLYAFNFVGGSVDVLLNNETNSCSEIKRVVFFKTFWSLLILELIRSKSKPSRQSSTKYIIK